MQFGTRAQEPMPEITKLNLLNHLLQEEGMPPQDKHVLIYEKVLEELNASVAKHQQMLEYERSIIESDQRIMDGKDLVVNVCVENESMKVLGQENRQLEKDVNAQLLRSLELKV